MKILSYDEAMKLIGDCQTLEDARKLEILWYGRPGLRTDFDLPGLKAVLEDYVFERVYRCIHDENTGLPAP